MGLDHRREQRRDGTERRARQHQQALALEGAPDEGEGRPPAAKAPTSTARTTSVAEIAVATEDRRVDRRAHRAQRQHGGHERGRRAHGRGSGSAATFSGLAASWTVIPCWSATRRRRTSAGVSSPRPSSSMRPSRMRTMRVAACGHGVVVGDEQDRLAAGVQAAEQLEHLEPAVGVERAGGLVGEQQGGLVGQGPGDGQALALPTGEHARARPPACRPGRACRGGRGPGSRPGAGATRRSRRAA